MQGKATMAAPHNDRLASIIIPCWNQLDFTRLCLTALARHTRPPWELIVIDNGSTDGTAAYLSGVRDVAPMPVTVISNSKNLGFPAAINQGLRAARGEYFVLLNNDAVVTDGWLSQLVALAEMDQAGITKHTSDTKREDNGKHGGSLGIGLVGPMSSCARRRNWWGVCRIRICKRCMTLPASGGRSIGGSGSRRGSSRGFACS